MRPKNEAVKWEYYIAWLSFISGIIAALIAAFNNHKPPNKDDYKKPTS